jgi:hypothetical protein
MTEYEQDVIDRLARIEERIDAFTASKIDHEDRLRTLEKRQWFLSGVAIVVGALLGKVGLHIPGTW